MKHDPRKYRRVRMTKQVSDILDEQMKRFRQKFGRDPRPEDPVLFDEDADEPRPISEDAIEEAIVAWMRLVNIDPAFIHAFQVTGRLVTQENMHLLTEEELHEWEDVVAAYRFFHNPPTQA